MFETISNLTAIDQFSAIVVSGVVIAAFWMIRAASDSTALAVVFTPLMVVGALAGNYLFRINFLTPTPDKDSNIVVASAVGVLVALALMVLAARIVYLIHARTRGVHQPLVTAATQDSPPGTP